MGRLSIPATPLILVIAVGFMMVSTSLGLGLEDGLVAYYPFEGNANDLSGNSNNGAVVNGAGFAPGVIGQAVSLDGVDDFVEIPHGTSLEIANNTVWTEAFWFKTICCHSPRLVQGCTREETPEKGGRVDCPFFPESGGDIHFQIVHFPGIPFKEPQSADAKEGPVLDRLGAGTEVP